MQVLRAATITVADVGAAVARYTEWLDYGVEDRAPLDPVLARSWGCPACAGRDHAVLRPASGEDVFIRLIEAPPVPEYVPLRSPGWAAVELCVTDVLAVQDRMASSPFAIVGPAKEIDGLPTIFPMQVRGPDQEIVYLTQIRDDLPEYDLPRARTLIDRPFILVLACSNMAASADWFAATLGVTVGRAMDIQYTMLADAFGTPHDQLYRLCTLSHGRDICLELDQLPPEATARPAHPGDLPPGPALTTLLHPGQPAPDLPWITPPVAYPGPVYGGRRAGTLRAPDGSLVEIVLT